MSDKCKTCRFRSRTSNVNTCDYIVIAGHRRGCPAGDECTRYEKGNPPTERVEPPMAMKRQRTNRGGGKPENLYQYQGRMVSIAELAEETGINRKTLYGRINNEHMTPEEAVGKPLRNSGRRKKPEPEPIPEAVEEIEEPIEELKKSNEELKTQTEEEPNMNETKLETLENLYRQLMEVVPNGLDNSLMVPAETAMVIVAYISGLLKGAAFKIREEQK